MQVQSKARGCRLLAGRKGSWLLAPPVLFPSKQLGLSTLGRAGSLTAEEVGARVLSCSCLSQHQPISHPSPAELGPQGLSNKGQKRSLGLQMAPKSSASPGVLGGLNLTVLSCN